MASRNNVPEDKIRILTSKGFVQDVPVEIITPCLNPWLRSMNSRGNVADSPTALARKVPKDTIRIFTSEGFVKDVPTKIIAPCLNPWLRMMNSRGNVADAPTALRRNIPENMIRIITNEAIEHDLPEAVIFQSGVIRKWFEENGNPTLNPMRTFESDLLFNDVFLHAIEFMTYHEFDKSKEIMGLYRRILTDGFRDLDNTMVSEWDIDFINKLDYHLSLH